MSTTTKKRGIVDPWKVTSPLTPPPPIPRPEKQVKVDLAEIDRDEDIRLKRTCVIRGRHAAIEVNNRTITSENDALRDLVKCLFEILALEDGPELFDAQHIGIKLGERVYEAPLVNAPTSQYATSAGTSAVVWFRGQDLDEGLLRLVRLLRTVQRRPGVEGETLLKRWGVIPMLR